MRPPLSHPPLTMPNNTDTDPIASSRYEIVCVLAITGWIAAFFLLGILIGASK